jgi:hypothetical protein
MKNLIKQPNGKYCSVDYQGKASFVNYTEQDIIDMYIKQAKEDMENADHYGKIIEKIEYGDRCSVKRTIRNKELESMGFDRPYEQLVKFIPREPLNQSYAPCDFTTYAKCPNCGGGVQNGMGHKDEKCRNCEQLLKWK